MDKEEPEHNISSSLNDYIDKIGQLLTSGDLEKSKEAISGTIKLNLESPDLLNRLATIIFQMADVRGAKEIFSYALKAYLQHIEAMHNLSLVEIFEPGCEKAINTSKEIPQIDPAKSVAIEQEQFIESTSEKANLSADSRSIDSIHISSDFVREEAGEFRANALMDHSLDDSSHICGELFSPVGKKPIEMKTNLSDAFIYNNILVPILHSAAPPHIRIKIETPRMKAPISIRNQVSDISCYFQIFVNHIYDFQASKHNPKLIVDGGAKVGYASIFFANKFPKAKIIAVEPEESNYKILKENTCNYNNIKTIKSTFWNKRVYLKTKDTGLGKWGFTAEEVKSKEPGSIRALTIEDILLENSGYQQIDILKLDIEGAEKEVFSENYDQWLDKVNIVILDLHDRIKQGCSESFYSAIKNYDFSQYQTGENVILIKRGIPFCAGQLNLSK